MVVIGIVGERECNIMCELVWVMIDHQITGRVCDIQRVRELGVSFIDIHGS